MSCCPSAKKAGASVDVKDGFRTENERFNHGNKTNRFQSIYILLDVSLCSIAEYFYEL